MPRSTRAAALLAKTEATYGVDSVPTGAANSMLVSKPVWNFRPNNVNRDLLRPFLGNSEELVGTRYCEVTFETELVGSGSAGVAPAWGPLVRACAMSETVEASTRVDYLPVTDPQESVTIYFFDSGVRNRVLGARGTFQVVCKAGEKPVLQFTFRGLYTALTAVALPTVDYSAFETPEVPTDANTLDLVLGGTLPGTGAPVITGGTAVPSLGLDIDIGNEVVFTPMIGGETVDIVDRAGSGKLMLDLTPAQQVTRMDAVLATTLSSVGLSHGTVVGSKVLIFAPSVQFANPTNGELNKRRLLEYDLRLVPPPAGSGNDEFRLVVSF
jgi:hypothetical protein